MISKKDRKIVLVFDNKKQPTAICNSICSTAKDFKTTPQSIHYACSGRCISCQGHYFRYMAIPITPTEFWELDLIKYDKMCGVERKIYKTAKMSRVGMEYNTKKKQNTSTAK